MSEQTDAYALPKQGNGAKIAIVILILLLIGAIVAAAYFMNLSTELQTAVLKEEKKANDLTAEIEQLERDKTDLASQLTDRTAELDRTREEWAAQVEELQSENQERIQRTYAQMDEIVYDSRKTLEYIGTIEDKLRAGKALDEKEAEQLRVVANGLTFLQQQYQKPITEFRELERYLSEQLAVPATSSPKARYGLLKRIFGKEYKEAQAQYYQDQGKREAFERARTKVTEAYARAQSQMRDLNIETADYLAQLDEIIGSNNASAAEIDDFFEQSKEVLKIHERIMTIEPEKELQQVRP